MLRLLVIASLLFAPLARATSMEPGSVTMKEGRNGRGQPVYEIHVEGMIAAPMATQLGVILRDLPNPSQEVVVILNSPGGSQQEGNLMVSLLRAERARGRFLETGVENGSMCASMCVPLFMQGMNRLAGEGSHFMFHGAIEPLKSNVPVFAATEDLLRILLESGVDAKWLNARREEGVFTQAGAWWISGRELFDAKANVITTVFTRHVRENAWKAPANMTMPTIGLSR